MQASLEDDKLSITCCRTIYDVRNVSTNVTLLHTGRGLIAMPTFDEKKNPSTPRTSLKDTANFSPKASVDQFCIVYCAWEKWTTALSLQASGSVPVVNKRHSVWSLNECVGCLAYGPTMGGNVTMICARLSIRFAADTTQSGVGRRQVRVRGGEQCRSGLLVRGQPLRQRLAAFSFCLSSLSEIKHSLKRRDAFLNTQIPYWNVDCKPFDAIPGGNLTSVNFVYIFNSVLCIGGSWLVVQLGTEAGRYSSLCSQTTGKRAQRWFRHLFIVSDTE